MLENNVLDNYIYAHSIYNGILLGARRVSLHKEDLNIANQFPVPDCDTGDNLHYQMSMIRNKLRYEDNINNILSSLCELAVLNSRGNSGAIFSEFFNGLKKDAPNNDKISLSEFVKCFNNAYKYSVNSMSSYILEGTILGAIKSWTEALEKNHKEITSLESLYIICMSELNKTVEKSKYISKEQEHSNYSDAGASAFLYFIEGFMSAVVYHEEDDLQKDELVEISNLNMHVNDDFKISKYKFCTEILVEKSGKKFDKNKLDNLGDSVVVSESDKYLKIHFHTNKPYELTKLAINYGKILESKCDDMNIQSISSKLGKTALVIDSIADIPEEFYSDDTYMLPINLLINNVSFKDKRTMCSELLNNEKVTSSQISSEEISFLISKLLLAYDNVIILTVSSKMSGLYDNYKNLIKHFDSERIHLVDTKLNSVAEGLVAYEAIEMINKNLDVGIILERLNKIICNTSILVSLKNLDRVIVSGRLNYKIGKILRRFNFIPIISINKIGEGKIHKFSFSEKKNKQYIIKNIIRNSDKILNYGIAHCNCREDAEEFAKNIIDILGFKPLYISDTSYVVQNFSGKGSIAISYIIK